jgi:hypothetical protein
VKELPKASIDLYVKPLKKQPEEGLKVVEGNPLSQKLKKFQQPPHSDFTRHIADSETGPLISSTQLVGIL